MPVQVQTRIGHLFERAKTEGRKPFIAYITGGDPTPAHTVELVLALEKGGADLIELGVPFSDPVADGPVIQRGAERALAAGTTLALILDLARQIRLRSQIPILLFSYMNPLLRYGFERLSQDAATIGIDGVLMTDLCVEEAREPVACMRRAGLDTVFLAAPTSTEERLKLVAEHSSGFIYAISRLGVTGEQTQLSSSAAPLCARVRALTSLPVALGFGISTPDHVRQAATIADGVVVGSAIVKFIENAANTPDLSHRLELFTRDLTAPLQEQGTGEQLP
jgi:tryptophan synthase alpha chain